MYEKSDLTYASRRITSARVSLLQKYPFFGKLVLRMKVRFGECGTACTDMESIIFDIGFMRELNDPQLEFVLLHEVLHCVFKHCVRGRGKIPLVYNIACDIVVNSFILEMLGIPEFCVGGENAMHLAPGGMEGRKLTAEEIYDMLVKSANLQRLSELYEKGAFDSHESWEDIDPQYGSELWSKRIRDAAGKDGKGCGSVPLGLRRYVEDVIHTPRVNWRRLLHDYISFDQSDYVFSVPDRRFQDDVVMPSFCENIFGDSVKGIWLFVDASGSVSDKELAILLREIYAAYEQMDNISGRISFFDTEISAPLSFESFDDLKEIEPIGGGGTSFVNIFKYLGELKEEELPELILIFTDGCAVFPDEAAAMNIPVVWLILGTDIEPPWGNTVYIDKD